jgi:putative colanic acid biosynthesis acetyltransferase WcaF
MIRNAQPQPETDKAASEPFRTRFGADTRDVEQWPYPKSVYVKRALWATAHKTIWKLCWKRIPSLRSTILRLFGARSSLTVYAAGSSFIEMPWDVTIGEYVAIGPRVIVYNLGGVTIGSHTVLSQDVYVCGGTHDYTDPTYPLVRTPIQIGSHVWIAAGAFIGPGVSIGEGAVVGARAVVIRDVPPWTVVAGNPARIIKKRELRARPAAASGPSAAAPAGVAPVGATARDVPASEGA